MEGRNMKIKRLAFLIAIIVILSVVMFNTNLIDTLSFDSPLTSDPVYCSMTMPSESQSDYMISIDRNYGKLIGDTSSPETKRALSIGAIYKTSGATLPDNFTVYLGKMNLFAKPLQEICLYLQD